MIALYSWDHAGVVSFMYKTKHAKHQHRISNSIKDLLPSTALGHTRR